MLLEPGINLDGMSMASKPKKVSPPGDETALEYLLLTAAHTYIVAKEIKPDTSNKGRETLILYRGIVHGLALALAYEHYPDQRGSEPWNRYVKKLEKRFADRARLRIDDPPF